MIIHSPIISGSLTFADGATFTLPIGGAFTGSIAATNGVVSGSAQITPLLPTGVVSGSSQLPTLATTGSNVFVGDQTITGSLTINDASTNFSIEGNMFGQAYLTAGGAIVLNPGYGGVEMVGSNRTFKATDITAEGFVSGEIRANNGVVSGSSQVTPLLPTGTVSGSSQITYASISSIPSGIVSGSSQVIGILAGLNTFSASEESKNSTLSTYTASIDTALTTQGTKNTTLASVTASLLSSQTNLNTYTGSLLNAFQVTGSKVNFLGDITIYGTQSVINSTNVEIADNILYLAPTASIDNDLGIVGHYNDGTYRHAGIFMDASDGHSWKVFNGLTDETSATVNTSGTGFTLADFKGGAFTGTSFTGIHNGTINSTNGVVSGSSQITYASISSIPGGIVSGSSQITLSSTTGYGTVINQNLLTTSNVQFNSLGIGMAASATAGRIDATNDIVAYSSSDIRFKENIIAIETPLDKISKIGGYTYNWKQENHIEHGYEGNDVGVIAQEIEAVLPQLVQTRENGYKAVKYDKLVALLIEGIKEQQKQIDDLVSKVNSLENKI